MINQNLILVSDELSGRIDLLSGGNVSCADDGSLLSKASPYLFPFILEYSLIALASMAGMYAGLNIVVTKNLLNLVRKALIRQEKEDPSQSKSEHGHKEGTFKHAHVGRYMAMAMASYTVATADLILGTL